jgi:hypothetical protein
MLYEVSVYHNITTAREAADRGDEECATLVRADERYADNLAAASRLAEPRVRTGDRLRHVTGLLVVGEPGVPTGAAEAAYAAAGNSPFGTPASRTYRAHGARSMKAGDVVVVRTSRADFAYGCEPYGWTPVDLSDFKIED